MKKQPAGLLLALFFVLLRTPFLTALSPDSVDNPFLLLRPHRSPQC